MAASTREGRTAITRYTSSVGDSGSVAPSCDRCLADVLKMLA